LMDDGRLTRGADLPHPAIRLAIGGEHNPALRELLRSGRYAVISNVDQDVAQMRIGPDEDVSWMPVLDDEDPDPTMLRLKAHLRSIGVRTILIVAMTLGGRVSGALSIRFVTDRQFRQEEIQLTCALAQQAMLAIQLTRLSEQSRQAAVVAERNRMARDIHDTLAQGFTGVIVQLEAADDAHARGLDAECQGHLWRARELARESLREARRSVRALRPQILEEKPLYESLDCLLDRLTRGTALRATLKLHGARRTLPPEWDTHLLRISQETLTNALRHARATQFELHLTFGNDELVLRAHDNGIGFDPATINEGFGLIGINERVREMGGRLDIHSAPGRGTELIVSVPLPNTILTGE